MLIEEGKCERLGNCCREGGTIKSGDK